MGIPQGIDTVLEVLVLCSASLVGRGPIVSRTQMLTLWKLGNLLWRYLAQSFLCCLDARIEALGQFICTLAEIETADA